MSVSLINGLEDLSRELGEVSVGTSSLRIGSYNDAVQEFFNERKWSFAIKKDTSLTTQAGVQSYNVPIDLRRPGGIKRILVGNAECLPIEWEDRNTMSGSNRNLFYLEPENNQFTFLREISSSGEPITIYYYAVPTRITDVGLGVFELLPDNLRKVVAYLAAAYVLWGRKMNADGNNKLLLYQRGVQNATLQQSERTTNLPKTFGNYLGRSGFRRVYP